MSGMGFPERPSARGSATAAPAGKCGGRKNSGCG
jgi:hypothetical protein